MLCPGRNSLGSFTVTKGYLQQIIMDVYAPDGIRFRIAQEAGSRVNIDDITLYGINPDQPLPGDVNDDGEVNIADINATIDVILSGIDNPRADVNEDGEINIADVNVVIAIILGS